LYWACVLKIGGNSLVGEEVLLATLLDKNFTKPGVDRLGRQSGKPLNGTAENTAGKDVEKKDSPVIFSTKNNHLSVLDTR